MVGFALSAGLLWLTWHQSSITLADWRFTATTAIHLAGAVLVFLAGLGVHVYRAHLLWKSYQPLSVGTVAGSLLIGNFFNVVLPGNLGEVVRAWHFHRKVKVSFWKSAAGIITEKFVDAQLFLAALLLLFVLWRQAWHEAVLQALFVVWAGIWVANGVLWLMLKNPAAEKKLWAIVPGKVLRKSLFRTFRYLIQHVVQLKKNGRLTGFSLIGYLLLACNMLQYYFVLKAAGITYPMNTAGTLFLLAMVMVVINVTPSAPGSAGVVHYGIFATLMLAARWLHLPQQPAAFALAGVYLHLSYFLPESLMGAYMVWRERKVLTAFKADGV